MGSAIMADAMECLSHTTVLQGRNSLTDSTERPFTRAPMATALQKVQVDGSMGRSTGRSSPARARPKAGPIAIIPELSSSPQSRLAAVAVEDSIIFTIASRTSLRTIGRSGDGLCGTPVGSKWGSPSHISCYPQQQQGIRGLIDHQHASTNLVEDDTTVARGEDDKLHFRS